MRAIVYEYVPFDTEADTNKCKFTSDCTYIK
jgi:hypothetical protein